MYMIWRKKWGSELSFHSLPKPEETKDIDFWIGEILTEWQFPWFLTKKVSKTDSKLKCDKNSASK